MKKTIFTIIILTLVFLGILFFSINKSNPQQINSIVAKDTVVIPPPTIDEIIE